MTVYLGTIALKRDSYAFIGRDTIRKREMHSTEIGWREKLFRTVFLEDVFVHQDDLPMELKEGQHFLFEIEPDPRRSNAYRAAKLEFYGTKAHDRFNLIYMITLAAMSTLLVALAIIGLGPNGQFVAIFFGFAAGLPVWLTEATLRLANRFMRFEQDVVDDVCYGRYGPSTK